MADEAELRRAESGADPPEEIRTKVAYQKLVADYVVRKRRTVPHPRARLHVRAAFLDKALTFVESGRSEEDRRELRRAMVSILREIADEIESPAGELIGLERGRLAQKAGAARSDRQPERDEHDAQEQLDLRDQ